MIERKGWARVFRNGYCLCEHAEVRICELDRRVGLTMTERRRVRVRFIGRVAPELRDELAGIVARRGAAAERYAERIAPVVITFDDERIEVRLMPPQTAPRIAIVDTVFPVGTA